MVFIPKASSLAAVFSYALSALNAFFFTAYLGLADSPWATNISSLRGFGSASQVRQRSTDFTAWLFTFHPSPFTNPHWRFLPLAFDVAIDFGKDEVGGQEGDEGR